MLNQTGARVLPCRYRLDQNAIPSFVRSLSLIEVFVHYVVGPIAQFGSALALNSSTILLQHPAAFAVCLNYASQNLKPTSWH